jgi:hypothetical protein
MSDYIMDYTQGDGKARKGAAFKESSREIAQFSFSQKVVYGNIWQR